MGSFGFHASNFIYVVVNFVLQAKLLLQRWCMLLCFLNLYWLASLTCCTRFVYALYFLLCIIVMSLIVFYRAWLFFVSYLGLNRCPICVLLLVCIFLSEIKFTCFPTFFGSFRILIDQKKNRLSDMQRLAGKCWPNVWFC